MNNRSYNFNCCKFLLTFKYFTHTVIPVHIHWDCDEHSSPSTRIHTYVHVFTFTLPLVGARVLVEVVRDVEMPQSPQAQSTDMRYLGNFHI